MDIISIDSLASDREKKLSPNRQNQINFLFLM